MANRMKEDDKNEKIIRGLLKLPPNRRCINCNNLGPQYVCTNFWTFICTNCSGVHREFTHRVKSISMAKFSSQEVIALQEGGNERAREIYFKDWDPQRHSFPDSSNIVRLRDFIKHVYVYRKFSGESVGDRPQKTKGDRDDYNENRRSESYRGGSRSPPYEEHCGDHNFRNNYGERSPRYDQGVYKKSPARFEVVDDRFKDDKLGNGNQNRRLEDHRFPNAPKPMGRSPDHQKIVDKLSPPMVRPVRDILGDGGPQLQVGATAKLNETRTPDDSTPTKSTLSSSSVGSTDVNSVQSKGSYFESLIDFDVDPEPSVAVKPEQSVPQQTNSVSSNGGDCSASDISRQLKVPQEAPKANPLVSALSQLSVSEPAAAGNIATMPVSGFGSSPKASGGENLPTMQQQQPSVFPSVDNLPSNRPSNAPVVGASNDQTWMSSLAPYGQASSTVPFVNPAGNLPRIATKPSQDITTGVSSETPSAESRSSGRKELPADLFTTLYPTAPVSVPGWQRGPYLGVGYNMQYPTGVASPTCTQTPKSVNPFDLTSDPAPTFPSATPMQVALPNMAAPATSLQTSSFGTPSPRWVPSQQFPYASSASPSPFMLHQVPNNMPQQLATTMMSVGNQGIEGPGNKRAAFGTSGINQNAALTHSQPNTPNNAGPIGGNPFG